MRMRRLALGVAALLVALGLWQLGQAGWIHAKALVAQGLLERAWARAEDGEAEARPWPWGDTWPVARLEVPRLGVDLIVLAGASGRTLAFGPGHHDGTAAPGEVGNAIISGHRDTHFQFLQHLERGDELWLRAPGGAQQRYVVGGATIVDYRQARLPLETEIPRLTLVTCYPFATLTPGGPLRYLVFAERAPP